MALYVLTVSTIGRLELVSTKLVYKRIDAQLIALVFPTILGNITSAVSCRLWPPSKLAHGTHSFTRVGAYGTCCTTSNQRKVKMMAQNEHKNALGSMQECFQVQTRCLATICKVKIWKWQVAILVWVVWAVSHRNGRGQPQSVELYKYYNIVSKWPLYISIPAP